MMQTPSYSSRRSRPLSRGLACSLCLLWDAVARTFSHGEGEEHSALGVIQGAVTSQCRGQVLAREDDAGCLSVQSVAAAVQPAACSKAARSH